MAGAVRISSLALVCSLASVGACAGEATPRGEAASGGEAPEASPDPVAEEPVADGPTATEPSQPGAVRHVFSIDGAMVSAEAFAVVFARLRVEETAYQGETVENQDGSYGGASESFHAFDGDVAYDYTVSTVPHAEGQGGYTEGRSLQRVDP